MIKHIFTLLLLVAMGNVFAQNSTATDSTAGLKAYKLMQIPGLHGRVSVSEPIVVAIVDDGFLLTHQLLRNYIYTNTAELPNNGVDDDGNGYVDDVQGYDVSDHDHNVSIPKGKEQIYYHGTMIAGAIVRMAEMAFGPNAYKLVKILPIKALSDATDKTYIKDGYDGIEYALTQNPDIIVCAWSGGTFDSKYQPLFAKASSKGIAIFGSAGNFFTEQVEPPASLPTVYAIAAIDSNLHKLNTSNYGSKIDLAAPGDLVYAPHPISDNAHSFIDGTSASVALVAGAATVLKIMKPEATALQLITALKNTATPIDGANPSYAGKLGAGIPNVSAAVNYLLNEKGRDAYFDSTRPEGTIVIDASTTRQQWPIQAQGGVKGVWVYLGSNTRSASKGLLNIYSADSLVLSTTVGEFSGSQYVAGSNATITYTGKRSKQALLFNYEMEPIDSTTLYCSGTVELTQAEGTITDGSGPNDYANTCNCKWLITVPEGKRIYLEFDEFSTQAKTDFVYLFAGDKALQENTMAMFSGPGKPPVIITPTNQVLVWFVTDGTVTAPGWQLQYHLTDEEPFVEQAKE